MRWSDRMPARWLFGFWMRRDVHHILDTLSAEDRGRLRATPEDGLIRFHRSFGMGLRNAFRHGKFRGLQWHCGRLLEARGEPLSFDVLSSAAIHELWQKLQTGT